MFVIQDDLTMDYALKQIEIDDIWGIGWQYHAKLEAFDLKTAYDLSRMAPEWGRMNLGGVVGMRLIHELNGLSCIDLEMLSEPKQNISATRAFGKVVTEEKDISEALSFHVARAAEKLRQQGSVAKIISFFYHSNPFSKVYPYFKRYRSYELPVATNDTRLLNAPVQAILKRTFMPGIRYHKCGVYLQELYSADTVQEDLFAPSDRPNAKALMQTIDQLNIRFGHNTAHFASTGFAKS